MERLLIRAPFVLVVINVVVGIFIATSFPPLAWLVPVMIVTALVFSVYAAFVSTRFTIYYGGMSVLMRLNFCLFAVSVLEAILDSWLSPHAVLAVVIWYLTLLSASYLLYFRSERRANWSEFSTSLASPTLAIENLRVRRIPPAQAPRKARSSSSAYANIGAALGIGVLTMIGAVFGAHAKELVQIAVATALILSPLVFLRYIMAYFVGVSEVRKVERKRGLRFELDNVDALQEERSKLFIARLLNPRLRHQG
ncbi:hypothetical protein AAHK20_31825 [Trinickia sp. YCB016]